MHTEPQKEHQWLQKLVGEWTFEGECRMGPDQPPMKLTGSEVVRSLGGLWTIGEGQGTCQSIMTLGYDPQTKRFAGTFIASVMTHLWVYDGSLDAAEKVLTLDTEGPKFTGEGLAKYQDIIEFVSDDHRTLSSQCLGDDGQWHPFMKAHYRRKK
ncbi:MAG: DUF1579 domain-containing protein [Planctomycetaceae bacterium]|nr:DUF1579 domain-containing protein [Planctomycetaceae bacterium]